MAGELRPWKYPYRLLERGLRRRAPDEFECAPAPTARTANRSPFAMQWTDCSCQQAMHGLHERAYRSILRAFDALRHAVKARCSKGNTKLEDHAIDHTHRSVSKRNDIPAEVLLFLSRRIETVPHLEALLLLWEQPLVDWTETQIAARVYVSHERAGVVLSELLSHGLICSSPDHPEQYRYNSAWDQTSLMVKVAASYRTNLVHVAGLIHAKATSDAVKHFARAFEFKKKE